jgi:hypothetical protein
LVEEVIFEGVSRSEGVMADKFLSGEDFRTWRLSRRLTMAEVGKWFGLTYQAVQHLERSGTSRTQALAISAIERGLKPWEPTELDREEALKPRDTSNEESDDDADAE